MSAACGKGPLVILSGPSGVGKSSVIKRLLAECRHPLRLSVSATTRAPRPGEQDGVAYHFWDRERFHREVEAGEFLEWAEVWGQSYGTLRREVEPFRLEGVGVLLDIDVQGAAQVRAKIPDHVSVFLRTATMEAYERRLRQRGTESEESIQRRLAGAQRELALASGYDHQILNEDLDQAVADLRCLVEGLYSRATDA